MRNLLGSIAVAAAFALAPNGRAAAVDVVVLVRGEESELNELYDFSDDVEQGLRAAGQSQIGNQVLAFERQHSRARRSFNTASLERWRNELERLTSASIPMKSRRHERIVEITSEIVRELARVPERQEAFAATAACFQGLLSFEWLGRLEQARNLVDYCAGLAWMVTRDTDVLPEAQHILLPHVRDYRFTPVVEWTPDSRGRQVRLQGAETPDGFTSAIRTKPGTMLAVTASCAERTVDRVHWVVAGDKPDLTVRIDCAFDEALHSGPRGLWLSSDDVHAAAHAAEVAHSLEAATAVVVSKRRDRYQLQRVFADRHAPSTVVSLPVVHTDRQLAAAVAQLLEKSDEASSSSTQPVAAAPAVPAAPLEQPKAESSRALLWSGVAVTAAGLAAEAVAWGLFAKRVDDGGRLIDRDESAATRWKDARAPLLGVGIAGGVTASAGVALLASASPPARLPWWVAVVSGAVGAGLVTWGAIDVAKGESCSERNARSCYLEEEQQDRGVLLLATAAPFLTLLVTKAIRGSRVEAPRVQAELAPMGVRLSGKW